MLFVLAEVLGANIFDLVKLLVILLLQVFSVRIGSRRGSSHKGLHVFALVLDVFLQFGHLLAQSLDCCCPVLRLDASYLEDLLGNIGQIGFDLACHIRLKGRNLVQNGGFCGVQSDFKVLQR